MFSHPHLREIFSPFSRGKKKKELRFIHSANICWLSVWFWALSRCWRHKINKASRPIRKLIITIDAVPHTLAIKVWLSLDQHHGCHLETWWKFRISSPVPDLLDQNFHFNKIPRWFILTFKSEQHCFSLLWTYIYFLYIISYLINRDEFIYFSVTAEPPLQVYNFKVYIWTW